MSSSSFSVLLSEKELVTTIFNISQVSDSTTQRMSLFQQTSSIFQINDECDHSNSLGVATVNKVTTTNTNLVSVAQWLFELSLGSSPAPGLGAGILTLDFAMQNYNFGNGAKNQIIWSTTNTSANSSSGVYFQVANNISVAPTFYVPNGFSVTVLGAVAGNQSSGPYLNAMGIAKLTYYYKAYCGYNAGDIVIEIDLDLDK